MLTRIYECTDIIADFFVCLLLARYVFLIPPLRTRRAEHLFWLAACLFSCVSGQLFGLLMGHQTMGFCLAIYIYLAQSGQPQRFLRVFQFFPIMGMALALILPLNRIPPLLLRMEPESQATYTLALYTILAIPLNLVMFRCKAQRQAFCEAMKSRRLERWEQGFLYSIGTMMMFFTPTLTLYDFDSLTGDAQLHFIHMTVMSSLVCFLVTLTVIILIMSGGKSVHLKTQVLGMQHNIIAAMADIVENRDENTGGHIKRTAKYVEIIAVNLKVNQLYTNILTDQYIADMIIAAPLHDIGKIHIPDAVLKKQGRFTDEEFQIMKSHTTAGRRLLTRAEGILGKSSYLDIAVQMANYHHEWWNG
ncbi:MAG: HD domain-containing protein, partial [Oscillospiraceae bacterium]|nr:HD domain-containing protein [Oscillospiraceae bacterium]